MKLGQNVESLIDFRGSADDGVERTFGCRQREIFTDRRQGGKVLGVENEAGLPRKLSRAPLRRGRARGAEGSGPTRLRYRGSAVAGVGYDGRRRDRRRR